MYSPKRQSLCLQLPSCCISTNADRYPFPVPGEYNRDTDFLFFPPYLISSHLQTTTTTTTYYCMYKK